MTAVLLPLTLNLRINSVQKSPWKQSLCRNATEQFQSLTENLFLALSLPYVMLYRKSWNGS